MAFKEISLSPRDKDYDDFIKLICSEPPEHYRSVNITWARRFQVFYNGQEIPDVPSGRLRGIPLATFIRWDGRKVVYRSSFWLKDLNRQIDRMATFLSNNRLRFTEAIFDEDISCLKNCLVQLCIHYSIKTIVKIHGVLGAKRGFLPLTANEIHVWDEKQKEKLVTWGCRPDAIKVVGYIDRYLAYSKLNQKAIHYEVCRDFGLNKAKRIILVCPHTRSNFGDGEEDKIRRGLDAIIETLSETETEQFIVKLHPGSDDLAWWKCLDVGHPIVKNYDTWKLIIASDIVISHHSTVALDAHVLGKKVIVIEDGLPSGVEEFDFYKQVHTSQELANELL